ncbi:MAG TPA: hypothetical protein VGI73_11025 [Solirubrobacterales bacterium]|jgi:hypothetical protein
MNPRVLVPLLSLLACLALAAPCLALGAQSASAAGVTGNWTGETSQGLKLLEEPYTTTIGFSVLRGRIVDVVAEVRMECGEYEIDDAVVRESYEPGRGPKVAGGFTFSVEGVTVHGHLGRATGSGTVSAREGNCSGTGDWRVRRVRGA